MRRRSGPRRVRRVGGISFPALASALIAFVFVVAAAPARAVNDTEEFARIGSEGTGAGQLSLPTGSATDPVTGHVYVGAIGNHGRIDEFTPWGGFVKAFGFDVAPGSVNEQQEVRLRASAGAFRLEFGSSSTSDLPFDASAGEVENALDALPNVSAGGGAVSVSALPGNASTSTPGIYVVAFKGSLAGTDVPQLAATSGTPPLSGGNPTTSLEVRTRVDGTSGTTGLESCTAESGCKAGLSGAGAGEIRSNQSVAVDPAGNIYVRETVESNDRVQKFTPAGHFILMFGGKVNKTEVHVREEQEAHLEPVTVTPQDENLCTAASGDECGAGAPGTGEGQFSNGLSLGLGPSGSIYVGDAARIQRFNEAGEFEAEIPIPGKTVRRLSVDPSSGDLYVVFQTAEGQIEEGVHRLNPVSGEEIGDLKVGNPNALATDLAGDLYAIDEARVGEGAHFSRVLEFSPAGNQITTLATAEKVPGATEESQRFPLRGLGTNSAGDLYVSNAAAGKGAFLRAFGPPPLSFESPPRVPPEIAAQFALSVGTESAELGAQINPRFWNDTEYYVEYGTAPCFEGGCATKPLPPGGRLTDKVTSASLPTAPIAIGGLSPETIYHYRFVAQSSGGGPVFGLVGQSGAMAEGTFTTPRLPETAGPCPANEAFRSNSSALLLDCRAYEMVSPVEKANGDIVTLNITTGQPATLDQSSISGDRLAYGSYRAFSDAESAPYTSEYVAARNGDGWSNHAISPPHTNWVVAPGLRTDTEFKAFSPDLCQSWLTSFADPPLAAGAPEGHPDLYRRQDSLCGGEAFEAMNIVEPAHGESLELELQGVSGNGNRTIFLASAKLTPDATVGKVQLYGHEAGNPDLRMICILPDGEAFEESCSGGQSYEQGIGTTRKASVTGALSSDGSGVFWTAAIGEPGKIYLRKNPFAEGAECLAPGSPCTIAVSKVAEEESTTDSSQFRAAAADGNKAIFTTGSDLYEFKVEGETTHLIAHKILGLMGLSDNVSKIYFVSEEALAGNAVSGQRNLYLYEADEGGGAGKFKFIGAIVAKDMAGGLATPEESVSPIDPMPSFHTARVSADGRFAVFTSFARLTGYDNTDIGSGESDSEVFLYDAGANGGQGKLVCASCNPSGERPQGANIGRSDKPFWSAAEIPPYENNLFAPRVLADDGSRLFFNTTDRLVPRDTNGTQDVYEWERPGVGSCLESSPTFSPANGGCIDLISSGLSIRHSELVDASPSGNDVFFTTLSSLLPQDPGLVDIYDARVDGGFPAPPPPKAECEGEACQSPPLQPLPQNPSSSTYQGPGNPAAHRGRRCSRKAQSSKRRRRQSHCKRRTRAKR